MEPDRVVEGLDVIEDGGPRVLSGRERVAAEQILLEGGEEALGDGVDAPMSSECGGGGEVGDDEAVEPAGEMALEAAEDLPA